MGHTDWLLSLPQLQHMGFRFLYGNLGEGAFVSTPSGYLYPLRRGARTTLWGMRCHCPERGRLVYGDGPGRSVSVAIDLDLALDSGSSVNCAGEEADRVLEPLPGAGRNAVAAGGHPLVSAGLGIAALEFPPPGRVARARVVSIMDEVGRLSFNQEQHVRVVLAPNEPALRPWPLLLEGPLSARFGGSAASHAVPSHLDAFVFEDGRYRTGAPVLGLVGDGAAGPGILKRGDVLPDLELQGSRIVTSVRPA